VVIAVASILGFKTSFSLSIIGSTQSTSKIEEREPAYALTTILDDPTRCAKREFNPYRIRPVDDYD